MRQSLAVHGRAIGCRALSATASGHGRAKVSDARFRNA